MGRETLGTRQTFGLFDLGLLDDTPEKSFETIVALTSDALKVPTVAFFVFDDHSADVFLRAVVGDADAERGLLDIDPEQSVTWLVRHEATTISISNLALRADTVEASERRLFSAAAYLGTPVFGPMGEIAGVLAAMTPSEYHWTRYDRMQLGQFAYLLSEQIMLRAALKTLKLVAEERDQISKMFSNPH